MRFEFTLYRKSGRKILTAVRESSDLVSAFGLAYEIKKEWNADVCERSRCCSVKVSPV